MLERKKCSGCGAFLASNMTHCPVCGKFSGEDGSAELPATAYVKVDEKALRLSQVFANFKRMLWLLAVVSLAANLYTTWGDWKIQNWWSFYFVFSVIIVQLDIFYPVSRKKYYWKEVFFQLSTVLLFLIFVDWFSDLRVSWSLAYAVPVIVGAFILTISLIIAIRTKADPGNSLLVLLTVFLFSGVLFMLGAFVFRRELLEYTIVPSFVTMILAFVLFAFFATFKFREFVRMLFKRFHV